MTNFIAREEDHSLMQNLFSTRIEGLKKTPLKDK
jgi:hypothetical protein